MMEKSDIPNYELDLFDFIDILLKRKYLVLSIFGAVALIATIYCFGLRGEIPAVYKIQMVVRCPGKTDVVSYDPDKPKQKINIGNKVASLIRSGAVKGKLQKQLKLETVPEINVEIASNALPVLTLRLNHHDKEEGKKILNEVNKFLQSDQIIQSILNKENKLISADIKEYRIKNTVIGKKNLQLETGVNNINYLLNTNREWMDRLLQDIREKEKAVELIRFFEKQLLQLTMNRTIYNELLNRYITEINQNKSEIGILENKLENIGKAFEPEGSISSSLIHIERISNQKIIAISGIIGLALGILFTFILEVRARRSNLKITGE